MTPDSLKATLDVYPALQAAYIIFFLKKDDRFMQLAVDRMIG